jgi:prepilin-type N-terminal cleavage/methylation domain-containing protein
MRRQKSKGQSGFSMIELMVVCLVMLVVAGYAVPNMLTFIHTARLRGSASDYASVLQVGRIRSVQDDTFYSTYIFAGPPRQAYVDLTNNLGTAVDPKDPSIEVSSEVTPIAAGSAPDTTDLQGLFLPTGAAAPTDGMAQPVIFGPRGLPCATQTVTGGTICTYALGTSFWVFFQDTITTNWEAVTISPAGRIQKWQHAGTSWSKL